jgi:hypothetical protein
LFWGVFLEGGGGGWQGNAQLETLQAIATL